MDQPHDRSHLPHAARRRPRRPRPHRPDRARHRPDHRARVAPDLPGPRRRGPLPEPDLERPADHARDPAAHGGQARRECRRHHARPAPGLARLRLHLGHHGDRRGGRVRPPARGPARGQAHHPDHRGLRRVPRLRRQAPRRPHPLPRRRQRHRPPLHRGPRLRGAGVRLVQRGGRPPRRPHLRRLDPRRRDRASGATRAWTRCSSPAPACAWPRWRPRSRRRSASRSRRATMRWRGTRCGWPGIADLLPQWGRLFAAGLPED